MFSLSWSNIKSFFHNPVIKISYLVVIGLPIILELLEAAHILPKVSGSVYELFYSGVLMLTSRIIYGVAAPDGIKNYIDYHEYVAKHLKDLLTYNPSKRINVVMVHLDETEAAQRRQIEMLHKTLTEQTDPRAKKSLEVQLLALVDPLYTTCVIRYLEKEWFKANTIVNRIAMLACSLLNLFASILAIIVFIHRIIIVVTHNFSS